MNPNIVQQRLQAEQRGADQIRSIAPQEQDRRRQFNSQNDLNNVLNSFSIDERQIITGRPPPYSRQERDVDEQCQSLTCPITLEVPDIVDIRIWRGSVHSLQGLRLMREQNDTPPRGYRNPRTRSPLTSVEFHTGEDALEPSQMTNAGNVIANCESQTVRREARLRFDALHTQYNNLLSTQAGQQSTRAIVQAEGREIIASPLEHQIRRRVAEDNDNVALAGINGNQPRSPTRIRLENSFNGPPRNRVDLDSDPSDDEDINPVLVNGGGNNSTNRPNQQQPPAIRGPNPLQEQRQARVALPGSFWGDGAIEECTNNFFIQCETAGWSNNLYRRKTTFLRERTASLFQVNGPYSQ